MSTIKKSAEGGKIVVPRDDEWIKTAIVAEMIKESRFVVWRWARDGILPKPVISGAGVHPRWRRSDIETFLRDGTTGGES